MYLIQSPAVLQISADPRSNLCSLKLEQFFLKMCLDKNDKLFLGTRLELSSPSKEDNIQVKFCHSAPLLLLIGIRWTDWGHRHRPCGSTAPRRTMFSLWQVCHNISKAEAEANFINELGSKQRRQVHYPPIQVCKYVLVNIHFLLRNLAGS